MDADVVIVERLNLLRQNVDYLKSEAAEAYAFPIYAGNMRLKKAVERSLHVSIEACLDIARHVIAREGFRFPQDYQDAFRILAEEHIVSPVLLSALLEMARFCNLIVHDYAKIDDARVYDILKLRLGDFDAFAQAIVMYLSQA